MSRLHLFADESGNFDFSRGTGASRYFILTAVTFGECGEISARIQQLRHQMAWEGYDHVGPFHAAHDPAPVRHRIFEILEDQTFRVDSLIVEKAKAHPRVRQTEERFYKYTWFYLMKYLAGQLEASELLVVTASIGRRKKRTAFYEAVRGVMRQVSRVTCKTACWDAGSEACLQVADYCGWAIQRKWEGGAIEPYGRIADKVRSEFDLLGRGTVLYY